MGPLHGGGGTGRHIDPLVPDHFVLHNLKNLKFFEPLDRVERVLLGAEREAALWLGGLVGHFLQQARGIDAA